MAFQELDDQDLRDLRRVLARMPFAGAMQVSPEQVVSGATGEPVLDLEKLLAWARLLQARLDDHVIRSTAIEADLLELQQQRRYVGAFLAGALHDAGIVDRLPGC